MASPPWRGSRAGIALVGSPDTVSRRLEEQRKLVGHDLHCTTTQSGDTRRDLVLRSRKLFEEQVIPAFS